jgi:hypothetical protein
MRIARPSLAAAAAAIAVCLLPSCTSLRAQTADKPDISGFWQLRYDGVNIPKPSLTAAAQSTAAKAKREEQDLHVIRFCNHIGMPAIMGNPTILDIRQSDADIAIFPPAVSPVRHIYTDGRSPNWEVVDPTTIGYSLGHWDGDKLLVETRDFNDKGITDIPGGGYRTENSRLFESYQLVEDGSVLQVKFTWIDPKVFAKPYTYALRYSRMPPDYRAEEWYCNARDDDRAHFLLDTPTPVEGSEAAASSAPKSSSTQKTAAKSAPAKSK